MVFKPQYCEDKYLKFDIKNFKDNNYTFNIHSYLYGVLLGMRVRASKKWHNLILITGNVGDGKSSFIQGLAGMSALLRKDYLTLDKNVCWTTDKVIAMTDRDDNYDQEIFWDEAIDGAGGRNMALTTKGNKLKKALVTKRTKRHTYFFAIDEVPEYSWKLIKLCTAWFHIDAKLLNRGYWKCYTKKNKIKYIYDMMKEQRKTWDSFEIKNCNPDSYGQFDNWENIFFDAKEYEKRKIQETKQAEEEEEGKKKKKKEKEETAPTLKFSKEEKRKISYAKVESHYLGNPEITVAELAVRTGLSSNTVRDLIAQVKFNHNNAIKSAYNNTPL
jgi:hypothetical protein